MKYTLPISLALIIVLAFGIKELELTIEVFFAFLVVCIGFIAYQFYAINKKTQTAKELYEENEYLSVELGKTEQIKEALEKQIRSMRDYYEERKAQRVNDRIKEMEAV